MKRPVLKIAAAALALAACFGSVAQAHGAFRSHYIIYADEEKTQPIYQVVVYCDGHIVRVGQPEFTGYDDFFEYECA